MFLVFNCYCVIYGVICRSSCCVWSIFYVRGNFCVIEVNVEILNSVKKYCFIKIFFVILIVFVVSWFFLLIIFVID